MSRTMPPIPPPPGPNPSNAGNPNTNTGNHKKDYKRKYKGLKAEMAVLTKRIDDLTKGKSEKVLIVESFDWDEESVSSEDERTTMIRAFMAITKDEPSVGKADERSGQWVDITMKKVHRLLSLTNGDERKHVLDFTHVDLYYVDDQRKNLVNKFNLLKQELSLHKSKLCNLKHTLSINCSLQNEVTRVNIENEYMKDEMYDLKKDEEEPLSPLSKLIGAAPTGTSDSLISLSDLTLNMADLTLNTSVLKNTRLTSVIVLPAHVIKRKTENKSPVVFKSCSDKKANAFAEKLLLTLVEENYLKSSVRYLDSGYSRHMTWVKQYLHKYSKESGPKVVFRDESLGDTKGYGSVNCNRITFTMGDYVDGLKHNLISISQLCDANFKVLFTKNQGTIFNQNDEVVLIALRRRDVYIIDMSSYNKESNIDFFAKASLSVNWIWHERLSHLKFKNINNLAKHNLISGLLFLTFSKDKNCSVCEKGKHHRASFKTKRSLSINKKMENLNEAMVNKLRNDNGTEFKNHKVEEFSKNMLNSAKLPKQFWGEAVNIACYTQNRSIIVKRHRKTTYDMFRGRSLDINYIYVFELPVYIHNHKDHLGKFGEKADDAFFLGFPQVAKAFKATSKDKKGRKHIMLPSVKMMKLFLKPAQKVMQSTSMKIDLS
uniref:Uncharacterized protein n=1 Tax=Tanacetum cinerariifolium TaxID=118510 RepID=A0A6L2K4W6_TANCI|nr:hypothetical protein [Tanacetum cinerariifolium]